MSIPEVDALNDGVPDREALVDLDLVLDCGAGGEGEARGKTGEAVGANFDAVVAWVWDHGGVDQKAVATRDGTGCVAFKDADAPAVRIGLFPRGDPPATLCLTVCLADTQGQAQNLYGRYAYADIERLVKAGWSAESNFHCAFMPGWSKHA